jgi:hypothetical protein
MSSLITLSNSDSDSDVSDSVSESDDEEADSIRFAKPIIKIPINLILNIQDTSLFPLLFILLLSVVCFFMIMTAVILLLRSFRREVDIEKK